VPSDGNTSIPPAEGIPERPKMLFVNGPWDYLGARTRAAYVEPFHALLRQDFDVTSVPMPCDLAEEVARHRPDIILFHTGIECQGEPRLVVNNPGASPEIPRLAFILRDPFTPTRRVALKRARMWGAHGVIMTFRPSDSPNPTFDDGFYLPWWVDDKVFKDYGLEKDLAISLTGSGWFNKTLYVWRSGITEGLASKVPFFHTPSLDQPSGAKIPVCEFVGEDYARLINRSYFSAGCGSENRYLTQKLFEIPGAGACLITEKSEALEAIGMRDGINCVFTDGKHVAERVLELLRNTDRLREITAAGHALIHGGHTQRHRRLVVDWFRLWKSREPGQTIVQVHPFKPLVLADPGRSRPAWEFPTENPFVDMIRDGIKAYRAGNTNKALEAFGTTLSRVPWVSESRLGTTMGLMRKHRYEEAFKVHFSHLNFTDGMTPGTEFDPVDQAVTALVLMCMKQHDKAVTLLGFWPESRHPSINAMRWVARKRLPELTSAAVFQVSEGDSSVNTPTLHEFVAPDFGCWVSWINTFLKR
jgi:hypothetical protein